MPDAPADQQKPNEQQPTGEPPAGAPAKGEQQPNAEPTAADLAASLADERRKHRETQSRLAKIEAQHMTDQERAIAEAKAEGKAEATKTSGLRLAAAEFRAAAVGRFADPAAVIELVDLGRYLDDNGEPDTKAIVAAVDKLATGVVAPSNGGGKIPAGPRGDSGRDTSNDFLRASLDGND
jgi:hypothetical protein